MRSERLLLPLILLMAFGFAFIPHADYAYPVHVDEWLHMAYSEVVVDTAALPVAEPFLGYGYRNPHLETGFYLFAALLHEISGIPWVAVIRYFPALIFVVTVLSVYVVGRRQGFGWQAALFACLVPTTVGLLGPAFFVPVAVGLLFIPLALFLVMYCRGLTCYVPLLAFASYLVLSHAPTAIGMMIIVVPFALLSLRRDTMHGLLVLASLGAPFLAVPWILEVLGPTAEALFDTRQLSAFVELPPILKAYGYVPAALALVGILAALLRGGRRNYGQVLGFLGLLSMLVIFYQLHYGLTQLYYRGLLYLALMMALFAGAGARALADIAPPERLGPRLRPVASRAGGALAVVLVVASLAIAVPDRLSTPYYHMIDDADYEAFTWISENVGPDFQRAILDPWKATAFVAITGKNVFARIHERPTERDREAYAFLDSGCLDTAFLRENEVSLVYTAESCDNPDLAEVRERVYLLRDDS